MFCSEQWTSTNFNLDVCNVLIIYKGPALHISLSYIAYKAVLVILRNVSLHIRSRDAKLAWLSRPLPCC